MRNIYLIGMPLAGKSTVAKLVSKQLNIKLIDTDELLLNFGLTKENAINMTDTFRCEETKLYLDDYDGPFIMATGGGIINNPKNFVNFNGTIIYLYLDKASLYYRITKYNHPVYKKYNYLDLYKKKLILTIYQSNSEAKLINLIQKKYDQYDLYLVNAGGLSHTSIALMDALKLISKPIYNIHLSDINSREDFRKTDYISKVSKKSFIGKGINSYFEALDNYLESLNLEGI